MNRRVKAELQKILDDKKSGSAELMSKLNSFLIKNHKTIFDLPSLFSELKQNFIQFENIQHYLIEAKKVCSSKKKFDAFLNEFDLTTKNLFDEIFRNSFPFLIDKKSILTISNSKTVLEILTRLTTNHKPEITICESRPKLEGRILAKRLLKTGVEINFITEAQAAAHIEHCDCILIGADALLKDGSVVNKVGSYTLAILANHFKKPFYVVSSLNKSSNKKSLDQHKEKPEEIWHPKKNKISIKNYYFEMVPANLITKIITN